MSTAFICPTCGGIAHMENDRARAVALCKGKHVTPRQMDVLEYVLMFRRTTTVSPTLQEIADELDVSKVNIFELVGELVSKGILRKSPHKYRSLEPVTKGKDK